MYFPKALQINHFAKMIISSKYVNFCKRNNFCIKTNNFLNQSIYLPSEEEQSSIVSDVAEVIKHYDNIEKVFKKEIDILTDLKKQIESIGATPKADPNAMRLENLRENLIHGGVKALNAFTAVINDTDRNKLRTLIKKATAELAKETGERPAARALFKYVKSELQRSGAAIPDELAKPYVEEDGK